MSPKKTKQKYKKVPFSERLKKLREFAAKKNGGTLEKLTTRHQELGEFVKSSMRKKYNKCDLSQEEINQLDAIGFIWNIRTLFLSKNDWNSLRSGKQNMMAILKFH